MDAQLIGLNYIQNEIETPIIYYLLGGSL